MTATGEVDVDGQDGLTSEINEHRFQRLGAATDLHTLRVLDGK